MKQIVRVLALISAFIVQTSFAAKMPLSVTFEETCTQENIDLIKKALGNKEQSLRAFFLKGVHEILDSAAGPYLTPYKALSSNFFLASEEISNAQKYLVVLWGLDPVNVFVLTDEKVPQLAHDIMQHFHEKMIFSDYVYQRLDAPITGGATVYASFVYVLPDGSIKIHESRADIESVSFEMVDGYSAIKPDQASVSCLLL